MPPKFKGEEDDWLDAIEVTARPKAGNKRVLSRTQTLSPQEANGTVTEIFPNQSAVRLDSAAAPSLCGYRMSTLAFGSAQRERSPVCVGDRVRVEAAVIVGRCERRNRIVRMAPNVHNPLLHILAANLDCLVVVAAAREPEFSSGIVDRFLVAASAQKIPQILCINKTDLIKPNEERPWSQYLAAGVTVVEVSAQSRRNTDHLQSLLRGKTAAFCGHSGVGKTSLLRCLLADLNYGRVGAVNQTSGRGRHTTSGAVLLPGPEGASFIDTPGVMNFGLIDVSPKDLLIHFPELHAAAAKCGADCTHTNEPACVLRALPRYPSYRAIRNSIGGSGLK